jgi:hypothetical protein
MARMSFRHGSAVARTVAGLALLLWPGCSLVFDGSRFRGGRMNDTDAGTDGGGPRDSRPAGTCMVAGDCSGGQYCDPATGSCVPCDFDGDGHVVEDSRCDPMGRAFDCDDRDPNIYPGAEPSFFEPRLVGSFEEAHRIRVFSVGLDRTKGGIGEQVLVIFQRGDTYGTPMYAVVPLGSDSPSDGPQSLLEVLGGSSFPIGRIWYDAQREDPEDRTALTVRVATVTRRESMSEQVFDIRSVRFDPPATWTSSTVHTFVMPADVAFPIDSNVALVRGRSGFAVGVPIRVESGGTANGGILGLGLGVSEATRLGTGYGLGSPWGSVSSGLDAVFAGSIWPGMVSLRVWNGSLDPMNDEELGSYLFVADLLGRPAIESLPGTRPGQRRFVLFVPLSDRIDVFVQECPTDIPLSSCSLSPAPHRSLTGAVPEPLLAATAVSESAVLLVMRARGGPDSGLTATIYDADSFGMMPWMDFPASGPIADLDVDARLVVDPEGSRARQILVAYAYVRLSRPPEPPKQEIWVGGARICAAEGRP